MHVSAEGLTRQKPVCHDTLPWLISVSLGVSIHARCKSNYSPKTIMPDITVKYLDEMERYTGSFEHGQQFFFAGKSLGLSKLGMNAIRMPAQLGALP